MITISSLTIANKSALSDINHLLNELSDHAQPFSLRELNRVLKQKHLVFLVAKENHHIIGMGLLWTFRKSLGLQGIIEDMTVNESHRGKGIGKAIAKKLIERAKRKKLIFLDLTSRPERVAANELYKRLGFRLRNTNVYRLPLGQ